MKKYIVTLNYGRTAAEADKMDVMSIEFSSEPEWSDVVAEELVQPIISRLSGLIYKGTNFDEDHKSFYVNTREQNQ